ncbi:MAG TPA: hypothetical protein VK540_24030 [Polyangiaceae bacterium]|jgi:pimeloyl-ACP methyl ester carboxylesterase|nr:hypothetical protein [Polyangiaceae bacterium]
MTERPNSNEASKSQGLEETAWTTAGKASRRLLGKLGIEKIDFMGWSLGGGVAEYARQIEQSPLAATYPDIDWEVMMRKTGEMNKGTDDWSADVAKIASPTLLLFADADMMYLEHIFEFYRLLGGGTRDAALDGSLRPTPNQLAIIPSTTHYDLMLTATKSATDHAKAFLAR